MIKYTENGVDQADDRDRRNHCHIDSQKHSEPGMVISLAEQIAQLEETAPVDFDQLSTNDAAAREHYLAVEPSALRKLHDSIVDPKYEGVLTTRKQLLDDDSDHSSYSSGGEDLSHRSAPAAPTSNQLREDTGDLSSTLQKKREEDGKKGKAILRQIAIWEALLDARIRLQKSVSASNALSGSPANDPDCRDALARMLEQATLLSEELFALQEHLLTANESLEPPPRKKMKTHDEISTYETELGEATRSASALENAFHPYLLQTLSKWSTRIQAVSPSVLLPSNRNAFSSRSSQHLKSAVQLIDESLSDHVKLLARTRIERRKGTSEDAGSTDVHANIEIFDDTDFYQQLLRDVIDSRGNSVVGNDDWMLAQRQKKSKKKVDTKASKGRKLRYEVHDKLQNFMVPVPVAGMWHEEQIDELFRSLLGKGFENERPERNVDYEAGFRLFG